ncbi:MAG TPA: hypothetical protein VFN38_17605 [Gemmatimonadaceae bacterium]|nr:hypothetical protein [Gemmatimonadaceae bacterium]
MIAHEVHMHTLTLPGRLLAGALLIGALLPAVTLAQAATPAKQDSVAKQDSATHGAAGKRSRLGALGRAAAAKAGSAANAVEQTTGVSKETMAKAALASTGVGAAAMLAGGSDSGGLKSRVAGAVGGAALQRMTKEHGAPAGAGQMAAMQQQMLAQQMMAQQMMAAQANAAAAAGPGSGTSAIETEYTQLALRAQSGDRVALQQYMQFQYELSNAMMGLQGLPPDRQQAAYQSAMRQAMTCAKSGQGCRTKVPKN